MPRQCRSTRLQRGWRQSRAPFPPDWPKLPPLVRQRLRPHPPKVRQTRLAAVRRRTLQWARRQVPAGTSGSPPEQ